MRFTVERYVDVVAVYEHAVAQPVTGPRTADARAPAIR